MARTVRDWLKNQLVAQKADAKIKAMRLVPLRAESSAKVSHRMLRALHHLIRPHDVTMTLHAGDYRAGPR